MTRMTKHVGRLMAVVLTFALASTAWAVDPRLESGPSATVVEVVDGDTVVLDDGSQVRLVGIQAPKLPLGRDGFVEQPLAPEAKSALEALALGQSVTLAFGGARQDRHGRWLAHLYRDDGLWLQGEMLDLGMARVYSFADNRALVADMLALETGARDANRGIWALPFYRLRDAGWPGGVPLDSFELVEGPVVDTGEANGRLFLNFGDDYKTDVTATVSRQDARLFTDEGIDLAALAGHTIRVRGWVTWRNGPSIEVSHPEQIEVLD
jgi:endonuclease YncB( thermonuclease family)